MENEKLSRHLEALLFASDSPVSEDELATLLSGFEEQEVTVAEIAEALAGLKEKYHQDEFAFEIRKSGGGYQFLTKKAYHPIVLRLNGDKYVRKLSAAALETLSIVAYKQPVTKSEIEEIRGVSADYSLQKLLEKELIVISGRKEDAIGKPLLYQTSRHFMDYLGINHPDELPRLKEILGEERVIPAASAAAQPELNGSDPPPMVGR